MNFGNMPAEMALAIDKLGYDLLRSAGYDVRGCEKYPNKRQTLKNKMKRDGAKLVFCHKADPPALNVWFALLRKGEKPITSHMIRFVGKDDAEEDDGETVDLFAEEDLPDDPAGGAGVQEGAGGG